MRLVQYVDNKNNRKLGLVEDQNVVTPLTECCTLYELANKAIAQGSTLANLVEKFKSDAKEDYQKIVDERRLLAPVDHPDPAHTLISGTGLTHLGSADTRDTMHTKVSGDISSLTDSMKMFRLGLEAGRPSEGETGVQPEWFFKGDGDIVVPPGEDLNTPSFSLDGGEEPEVVGLYLIGPDKMPYRLGFTLGNEFSDHKTEQLNYLYLAHSKLRQCSLGPEILLGDLPDNVRGKSKIFRDGKVVWEKEFLSGEDNMSHSIENLEYHHFKYDAFLRPGDLHAHFFGTGTLSFGDGFKTKNGDVFEISSDTFGRSLRNTLSYFSVKVPKIKPL